LSPSFFPSSSTSSAPSPLSSESYATSKSENEGDVIIFGLVNEAKLLERALLIDKSNIVLSKRLQVVQNSLTEMYKARGEKMKRKREERNFGKEEITKKDPHKQKQSRTRKGRFQKRRKVSDSGAEECDRKNKGTAKGKKKTRPKLKPYSDQEDSEYTQ
jgi:hypothetical protein